LNDELKIVVNGLCRRANQFSTLKGCVRKPLSTLFAAGFRDFKVQGFIFAFLRFLLHSRGAASRSLRSGAEKSAAMPRYPTQAVCFLQDIPPLRGSSLAAPVGMTRCCAVYH
jgi:hypothetical protein